MQDYDILVAGAGASGMCAAIAAAREGKRVLLVEKGGMLGGSNTQSLVCPLMGFHAGGRQAVRGLAQEIVDRLARRGGTLGHIPDPLGVTATITPIEPEILKQVYFEMLREEKNITLLLHTLITGAAVEQGRLAQVEAAHKGGKALFRAGVMIDATGDGDLAALAGVPCVFGREKDGLAQPMTLVIKIGGVEYPKIRAAMAARPDQFVLRKGALEDSYVAVSGYFEAVEQARSRGELTLPRDRVLLFQGVREGEAILNMSRVVMKRSTDAWELTQAETEGRAQADEILSFLKKNIEGFENACLMETGAMIGVRESRHIQGRYTLTERDVVSGAEFEDAVALCAFPIDIHDPQGKDLHWTKTDTAQCCEVPYRVMVPESVGNLLVTGRCVSATHEAAASVRITPTAMALGEAAGIAAALAPSGRVDRVDAAGLRERIAQRGGVPGKKYM